MASGDDPADIIDGKWKRQQTECSKAAKAQAVDGSDDASMTASTTCPKKKSKIASGAKKLMKKIVNKLAPQKSSAPSASPALALADSDDDEDAGSVMENSTIEEDDNAKLCHALATWNAPVYAFYSPIPSIEYHDGHKCYVWTCMAKNCHHEVNHFLDTTDAPSTKNLQNHVNKCWGEDMLNATDEVKHLCNA
ncbi:hypothetical protein ARMGADRAFT_1032205 [Armillaria gallica]|uniref:Uncharacterized protein n=1 Tax=Armillaria gallica TaxID=47427 RepID=A0A2H3D5X2_ARMGA|nr:hypothetical protein ARMGADRAFT_1032205 [Armillaria gallica]